MPYFPIVRAGFNEAPISLHVGVPASAMRGCRELKCRIALLSGGRRLSSGSVRQHPMASHRYWQLSLFVQLKRQTQREACKRCPKRLNWYLMLHAFRMPMLIENILMVSFEVLPDNIITDLKCTQTHKSSSKT